MQRPTDSLRADHRVVSSALSALVAIGRHVAAGGDFPSADLATLLRFLREFLLGVHLRKEYDELCPALAMRADEATAAMVGELTRRQEEVTELVHCLVMFWEPAGELTSDERRGFADTVEALAACARRMQEIEERQLFPACEAQIPVDDQLDWTARFASIEGDRGAAAWRQQLAILGERWVC
jgi:hemerythrin-like domain-containing protein